MEKYKILFVGDKVGKTNIALRIINDTFIYDHKPTQGLEVHKTEIEIDSIIIGITLFDTNIEAFYKNIDGFIIVYDITSKESFQLIDSYLKKVKEYSENSEILLIGSKMDLNEKRQVDKKLASDYAIKNGLLFEEVSSKTGENIHESFKKLIEKIYRKEIPKENSEKRKKIPKDNSEKGLKEKLSFIIEKEKELNEEKKRLENEKKLIQKELGDVEFDDETKKAIENFEQTQPGCMSCNIQ